MLQALRLLLLFALVLRGLVPVGFMPGTNPDGVGLSIVICSPDGARTVLLDADGEPAPGDRLHHSDCVYGVLHSGSGSLAPAFDIDAFEVARVVVSDAPHAPQVAGWSMSMRHAPHASPRAPPLAAAALA